MKYLQEDSEKLYKEHDRTVKEYLSARGGQKMGQSWIILKDLSPLEGAWVLMYLDPERYMGVERYRAGFYMGPDDWMSAANWKEPKGLLTDDKVIAWQPLEYKEICNIYARMNTESLVTTPRTDVSIFASWDADGGVEISEDLIWQFYHIADTHINIVTIDETVFIVTANDWISQTEAVEAIKTILTPPFPEPSNKPRKKIMADPFPILCPDCDQLVFSASIWSGPEPECEPGLLCPHCEKFIDEDDFYALHHEALMKQRSESE